MEKNFNNLNNLTYNGNVKVSIVDGKRTLYTYTQHNNGKQKLFEFIASCLIGNFATAKSLNPCRIACFALKDGETDVTDPANFDKVSTYVYCDSSKYSIITTNEDKKGVEVIFRFRIPYTCLVGGKAIRQFALFPNRITDPITERCADFTLAAGNEISVPVSGGNFTVVIEWKMILKDVSSN